VLVYLALVLPIFVAMAGLAIDGALLLTARRELQSTVDGAARAGATRIDVSALRQSPAQIELDPSSARAAALGYLADSVPSNVAWLSAPRVRVEVGRVRVGVEVDGELRPAFLRVVGIERVPLSASAHADLDFGIRRPGDS